MPKQKNHLNPTYRLEQVWHVRTHASDISWANRRLAIPGFPGGPRELWTKRRKAAEEIAQADERVSGQYGRLALSSAPVRAVRRVDDRVPGSIAKGNGNSRVA
jgi:hypothetical protein